MLLHGETFIDQETGMLCWCSEDGSRGAIGIDLVSEASLFAMCPDAAVDLKCLRKRAGVTRSEERAWSGWKSRKVGA